MSFIATKVRACSSALRFSLFFVILSVAIISSKTTADITNAEKALATLIGIPQAKAVLPKEKITSRVDLAQIDKDIAESIQARQAESHTTKFGETLDGIIAKYLSDTPIKRSIQRQAVVLANKHAFRRNNPHWMYSGRIIKLPKIEDYRRAIFKSSAQGVNQELADSDLKEDWIYYP